jgi:hypothetical protein
MISWLILILVITAMIIWFSSREDEKYSDPLGKTDSGYQSSRFERNAMNRAYASEIRVKRHKPKTSKKKAKKG